MTRKATRQPTDDPKPKVEELTQQLQQLNKELQEARRAPTRRRLPDTRQSITHKFEIGETKGYLTVGLFEDNTPGELFIKVAKEGSTIAGLCDAVGIVTSLALQYGVPLDAISQKLSHSRFEPAGQTRNPDIRFAKSVVDYIFRWLSHEFGDQTDQRLAVESFSPRDA